MKVLGVDPGHTTGICIVDNEGIFTERTHAKGNKELSDVLLGLDITGVDVIVMEDYKVFAHKAKQHIGSRVPAAQAIGIVEHQARVWGLEVIKQPANILPIAEKLIGVKLPSDHAKSHWVSAYLHACYYMVKQGKMLTVAQREARTGT